QAIAYPQHEQDLNGQDQGQRLPPSQSAGQPEAEGTAENVAHRVSDRVSLIALGRRGRPVAADDEGRVLEDLPGTPQGDREREAPFEAQPGCGDRQDSAENETM